MSVSPTTIARTVVKPAPTPRAFPVVESTVTTTGLLERQKTANDTGSEAAQAPAVGGVAASSALSPTVIATLAGETVIPWTAMSHVVIEAVVALELVSHAPQNTATRGRRRARRIGQRGLTVDLLTY